MPDIVPIFDGHNDALLRLHRRGGADPAAAFLRGGEGHLDLPKARAGGFAGGLFALFVPGTPGVRPRAEGDGTAAPRFNPEPEAAQKAVFAMFALLRRIEAGSEGAVRICRSAAEIEAAREAGALAAVVHVEGAEAIEPDLALLEVLHAAGLRSLGPVWSRPNAFGTGVPFRFPSGPDIGPGLTDLGRALVGECERLRIAVDAAHLNEAGFWDLAAASTQPLIASHSNAHALTPHSRNLTDRQLDAIRERSGLVGVNFSVNMIGEGALNASDGPLSALADQFAYLVERLGEDCVAFGSDFDGTRLPAEMGDASGLPRLIALMRERGFGETLIGKLAWGNWLGVLRRVWGG
jgi:membrane dipeptidase